MKKNKLVVFAIVMLAMSQGGVSEELPKPEGNSTAWTQFNLKDVDKNLGSKIAVQITTSPKNTVAIVAALVVANPDHAEAITTSAIVTLNSNLEKSLAKELRASASPS